MSRYFLQMRVPPVWNKKWETLIGESFDTLDEAKAALASRPFPKDYRIVEAYTVTRYKAVKL